MLSCAIGVTGFPENDVLVWTIGAEEERPGWQMVVEEEEEDPSSSGYNVNWLAKFLTWIAQNLKSK